MAVVRKAEFGQIKQVLLQSMEQLNLGFHRLVWTTWWKKDGYRAKVKDRCQVRAFSTVFRPPFFPSPGQNFTFPAKDKEKPYQPFSTADLVRTEEGDNSTVTIATTVKSIF